MCFQFCFVATVTANKHVFANFQRFNIFEVIDSEENDYKSSVLKVVTYYIILHFA